ncbi:hypothetical protein PMm318_A36540 [Pseudomonas moorei]
MDRAPRAALRFGAVVVDVLHQLPFLTGMGGTGEQGEQRNKAERENAGGANGLVHEAGSSDGMTTVMAIVG